MTKNTEIKRGDVVLTGDRPTGPLHLGHFAGSLVSRLRLQEEGANQTLLVADLQALTDNSGKSVKVRDNVLEVVLDYLAVGIDPLKTTIALQSGLPALAELTGFYLNLVTLARLERNPTVRAEIKMRGFERDIPAGFLCYPVSQAADITGFKATVVPVGDDQLPMIEQTNEISAKINNLAGRIILPECRAKVSKTGRLPGSDGRKASKSLGNALALGASSEEIRSMVRSMYTDPGHLKVTDPGQVEGNVVFAYLDAFDPDVKEVERLKEKYKAGGLGDVMVKNRLIGILEELIKPMRERRQMLEKEKGEVERILREGTRKAREVTQGVLKEVQEVFNLF